MLQTFEGVRGWLLPDRRRLEFWVWPKHNGEWQKGIQECQSDSSDCCLKVEILFEDVLETVGFSLDEGATVNGILFKVFFLSICFFP